jgi:large conductance mechanosensitive channel
MLKEFKTFIMRGNVIDLAVAVIVGAAFNSIVTSFINDVITPLLLKPTMNAFQVQTLEKLTWKGVFFGKFIASIINFLVTAFVVFLMIKAINRVKSKKDKEEVVENEILIKEDIQLLTEIRDLLKNKI